METRSMQEVFDIVSKHLLTQNEKSVELESIGCKYKFEKDGKILMCAVGCLIPDELYQKSMEGCSVRHLLDYYRGLWPYLGVPQFSVSNLYEFNEVNILGKLQKIHDNSDPSSWKKQLRSLADYYKLECKTEIFGEEGSEEESIGS